MIDSTEAAKFLHALCGETVATFQTFDDLPRRDKSLARVMHGPFETLVPYLDALQAQGAGVFVTVQRTNGRGRTKSDIVGARALYIDKDDGYIDDRIRLPPSIRVNTSPGKEHAYWLLRPDEPIEELEEAQRVLARHFESDNVQDLVRVLRLPGSWNLKREPQLVRAWYGDLTKRTIAEVLAAYPRVRTSMVRTKKPRPSKYESLVAALACARVNRNSLLYRAGLLARDLITAGDMTEDFAVDTLGRACVANGLWAEEEEKTKATLDRALHKEIEGKVQIDAEGFPLRGVGNLVNLLLEHPQWADLLVYDTRSGRARWTRPPPSDLVARPAPRDVTDGDATELAAWLSCRYRVQADRHACADILAALAARTPYDPVEAYLKPLVWDGIPRIETWLRDFCGAQDRPIIREMGARWLISAVARALAPGTRVDTLLVLEGPQGAKKTTLLQMLAGDAHYDVLTTFEGKDMLGKLRNPWIIELSELRALRSATADEDAKDFLSRRIDLFRPPYGRIDIVQPRRCVFAGTTNRAEYLTDPTGNRRYWPVTCGAIDIGAVVQNRDRLWAEAKWYYERGVSWWIERGVEGEQEARECTEALEERIGRALTQGVSGFDGLSIPKNASDVSMGEILTLVVHDTGEAKRAIQMRVAAILQKLGWRRYQSARGWRYRRSAVG
jgi:hypothetical protein